MMVSGVVETAMSVLKGMRNLPPWMRWVALLLIIWALANPTSRQKIWDIAKGIFQGGAFVLEGVYDAIMPMVQEHQRAQEKARLSLAEARAELPADATK